jgi:uncharacterized membrane protein
MKILVSLLGVLSLLTSCEYHNEEELFGIELCETDNISFSESIEPIINNHCTSCHSGASPSAALRLDSYESVVLSAQNSSASGMLNRISRAEGEAGAMPTNYRLAPCEITKITDWIAQGSLNN